MYSILYYILLGNENFDEEVTTSKPEKTVILDDQQNCIDSVNSLGNKSCK